MSRLGHTAANFLDYWKNKGGLSLALSTVLLLSKILTYQFKTPKKRLLQAMNYNLRE